MQNKSLSEIWRVAKTEKGEDISYASFQRHFQSHFKPMLDKARVKEKTRNEILSKVLQQDMEIAKKIRDHLQIIEKQIEKYRNMDLEPEDAKVLQEWINQSRLSIEQLLKHEDRLMPKQTTVEDLSLKLLKIVEDFPPEYLAKFNERLRQLIEEERSSL